MINTLPIGIVLPGAHRWHRTDVILQVLQQGHMPIVLIQPDDQINHDIPASTMIVYCPEQPTEQDIKNAAAEIGRYCQRWYVLPLDDYISETAAQLSLFATAPCYTPGAAHTAFHKHLLRDEWNRICNTLPQLPLMPVEYALCHDGIVVKASTNYQQGTDGFIVKPDAYAGSVGVMYATDMDAVTQGVAACANILKKEAINPEMQGITIDEHVLVEEAIPRKKNLAGCAEFTAHYLSFDGEHHLLGIAEKTIHASTFIETGHIFPSPSFPVGMLATLQAVTTGMLSALEVQNTISNWEYIITPDDRLAMVEGQLRPSGDHVMELMENALQVSPYHLLFTALNNNVLADLSAHNALTSMIYWPAPSRVLGQILSVHIPEQLPDGVHLNIDTDALLTAHHWQGPLSWYHRHISIIATAGNADEAMRKCTETLNHCILRGLSPEGESLSAWLVIDAQ